MLDVAGRSNDIAYHHRFVELDAHVPVCGPALPGCLRARSIDCPAPAGDALLLHHSWNDEEAWISTLTVSAPDDLLMPVEELLPA